MKDRKRRAAQRFWLMIVGALLGTCVSVHSQSPRESQEQQYIYPGKVWLDTDGVPIEAHSAGMLKMGETYYLYGQDQRLGHFNKTGVCCYSSKDLINWKYEGTALPTSETPEVVQDTGVLERPKVIYNVATNQYAMWMHLDANGYTLAEAGVAVSNSPTGPFEFVKSFRPIRYDYGYGVKDDLPEDRQKWIERLDEKGKGNAFRDMNLFVDDDGSAYILYSSEDNRTLYISRLSDDYLDIARPVVEGKT